MNKFIRGTTLLSALLMSLSVSAKEISYTSKYIIERNAVMNGSHLEIGQDGKCTIHRSEVLQVTNHPFGDDLTVQFLDLETSSNTKNCGSVFAEQSIDALNTYEVFTYTSKIEATESTFNPPEGKEVCFESRASILKTRKILIGDSTVQVPVVEITRKPEICSE